MPPNSPTAAFPPQFMKSVVEALNLTFRDSENLDSQQSSANGPEDSSVNEPSTHQQVNIPGAESAAARAADLKLQKLFAQRMVTVKSAGDKGLGLFASRNIRKGTRILVESRVAYMITERRRPTDAEILKYFIADKSDAFDLDQVTLLGQPGAPFNQERWKRAAEKLMKEGCQDMIDVFDPKRSENPQQVVENLFEMAHLWRTHYIRTNSDNRFAVFMNASIINHSCTHNVYAHYNSNVHKLIVHSIRDIEAGEELLRDYVHGSRLCRASRRRALKGIWSINCQCPACVGNETISQSRRRLIHEYHVMTTSYTDTSPLASTKQHIQNYYLYRMMYGMMQDEGLLDFGLALVCQGASEAAKDAGMGREAVAWTERQLDVMKVIMGDDSNIYLGYHEHYQELKKSHKFEGRQSTAFWP